MLRSLAMLGMVVALTVVPAVIHGRLTNRWARPADLQSAAARLEFCPKQIGDWKLVADSKDMSEAVARELRIAGYLERAYSELGSGRRAQVLLMVGMPGAISRHPPEICYASVHERIGAPTPIQLVDNEKSSHDFRLLQFQQADQIGTRFLVCYGFTVDGAWTAPEYPRLQFGGQPLLYKMQVLCDLDGFQAESQDNRLPSAVADFLAEFLPVFRETCIVKEPT